MRTLRAIRNLFGALLIGVVLTALAAPAFGASALFTGTYSRKSIGYTTLPVVGPSLNRSQSSTALVRAGLTITIGHLGGRLQLHR